MTAGWVEEFEKKFPVWGCAVCYILLLPANKLFAPKLPPGLLFYAALFSSVLEAKLGVVVVCDGAFWVLLLPPKIGAGALLFVNVVELFVDSFTCYFWVSLLLFCVPSPPKIFCCCCPLPWGGLLDAIPWFPWLAKFPPKIGVLFWLAKMFEVPAPVFWLV